MGKELDPESVAHLLRASEERYRSVVTAMAEGVVLQAVSGEIIKPGGTGLGLASCYGSVKQLRGSISVDSAPGHGASFIVRLLRFERPEDRPVEPPPRRKRPARETVLLVEDEELVRSATARGLREHGYAVLCASDAEEALRLAAEHSGSIHALLTDLVLPRMNGVALAGALGKTQPGMRVLFVSGYPHDVIESHGELGHGVELLAKPYSLDVLAQRLDRLLER